MQKVYKSFVLIDINRIKIKRNEINREEEKVTKIKSYCL